MFITIVSFTIVMCCVAPSQLRRPLLHQAQSLVSTSYAAKKPLASPGYTTLPKRVTRVNKPQTLGHLPTPSLTPAAHLPFLSSFIAIARPFQPPPPSGLILFLVLSWYSYFYCLFTCYILTLGFFCCCFVFGVCLLFFAGFRSVSLCYIG